MDATEIDDAMRDMGARGLVEVRMKSDDRTGSRRCYAFAEFKYEADAVDFLERNYPSLEIKGRGGAPARLYIEYSRERRQAPPSLDDWKCTLCHFDNFSRRATCKQCKAPRSLENMVEMRLDGQSDECPQQTPSQFVVVRDLAPSTNETTLAAGVKKLYMSKEDEPKQPSGMSTKLRSTAPIGNTHGLGAKTGSLIRVFMVRDKSSDISCNYGFAEFSTLDDARAAVAKYNAHPQFTISSKAVTIAFIHSGVFIPHMHPIQEQDRKFTFAATHNPTLRLSYWNSSVYASEHLTFDESLYEDRDQRSDHAKQGPDTPAGKESKKRKADKDLTAPSGKKVIAMAPQLQMWASKHAELHRPKESTETAPSDDTTPLTGPNVIGITKSITTAVPSVSYADLDQMCCLLCRRKFKNEPSLRRHEQISDMHKTSLNDEDLIAKATENLKALGKEPTSNYRDRAKERRLAHNQPVKPKLHLPRKTPPVNKDAVDPTPEPPAKPTISKGAGLLAKMGWSTGEGLGAEGSGRTDIIETMAYTPGVGLGAEGGKIGDAAQEAARATKGDYADFVSKAKDKARERYEKMG
ncbi:putative RNA-binding protein [Rosellinia necatrix]|uniref:Putative RNA-binding protein n=1 Tax=Rosellinia necatrix TaxID=77044 RepID=A0A1W2TAG3_ROSNE|nr:putative RNA-binding protein [Rosellinia necatrix]